MGDKDEHHFVHSKRVSIFFFFVTTMSVYNVFCGFLLLYFICINSPSIETYRLTYLHEGLEPKVVHRDIKSSNILLDKQWNAKVSDFGLAKLLVSEHSYVSTRVMGTFGYVVCWFC